MFAEFRVNLIPQPSLLQPMKRLAKELSLNELWFKRDDTLDLGLGGNKLRKLEYLAFKAINQGCDTLLTVGGPQTNHGRLTAAVAAKLGLRCVLVLAGEKPDVFSANQVLDLYLGAELIFQGKQSQAEVIQEAINRYQASGHKVYQIPLGGSNPIGAMGYFTMMEELKEQLDFQATTINHLVVTGGSLGTLAGIVLGKKYFGFDCQIHAIKIFPANPEKDVQLVNDMANEAANMFNLGVKISVDDFQIHTDGTYGPYYLEGYNVPDITTREMIQKVARLEGVFLDPVYTGKGFLGLVDLIKRGIMKPTDRCLFVHTGGSPSLFASNHLQAMNEDLEFLYSMNRR